MVAISRCPRVGATQQGCNRAFHAYQTNKKLGRELSALVFISGKRLSNHARPSNFSRKETFNFEKGEEKVLYRVINTTNF